MVTQTKWIERKFNFDFPIGIFPCIVERLRGTPARIEELTSPLSREALTSRIGDKWSIQEQVGHLISTERLHDGRIDDFLAGAPVLRAAEMTGRATFEANYNERDIRDILASFRTARKQFVQRLEALDEGILARTALHPRLNQPMRLVDMALFAAEHDDHHLGSIVESIKNLK